MNKEEIKNINNTSTIISKFQTSIAWENKYNKEDRYKDYFNDNQNLKTTMTVKLILHNKNIETLIVAQSFVINFPKFLEELKLYKQAIYVNTEYTKFKWLTWILDDKIRLIHQSFENNNFETFFDVLVDKDWFINLGYNFIDRMNKTINADLNLCKKWKM